MKQALDALETLARYENPETKIQVRKPKDGGPIVTMYPHKVAFDAAAAIRAAIEQAEKPVAWVESPHGAIRANPLHKIPVPQSVTWSIPLYTAPRQEQYDQTALELCKECGWKAMIPGDGCLVCARQKAKPVAWMYDFLADDRDEIIRDWTTQEYAEIEREKGFNVRPLYTAPAVPKPLRWVDTIIPGDRVIDNDDKTQARVSKLVRQRPAAPDYFKLEFDDGSYIDVTDNEMIANYKPLPEAQKPVAYADSRIHGWPDCFVMEPDPPHTVPLYTEPRQWVELTDEEVNDCIKLPNRNLFARDGTTSQRIARAIEAKLKEKNI